MQLTYDEIMDIIDKNYFPSNRTVYIIEPGLYEIGKINKTLEYSLHDIVKVGITCNDIRLGSNINNNRTLMFTKKSFS